MDESLQKVLLLGRAQGDWLGRSDGEFSLPLVEGCLFLGGTHMWLSHPFSKTELNGNEAGIARLSLLGRSETALIGCVRGVSAGVCIWIPS